MKRQFLWDRLISSGEVAYQDFAAIPARGTTTTLDFATNGSFIQIGELGGNTDIAIDTDWGESRLQVQDTVVGTEGTPYRLFLDGNRVGGTSITQGENVISVPTYWEVYDGILEGDPTAVITGIIGISGVNNINGSVHKFQNLVVKNVYFSGAQFNTPPSTSEFYQLLSFVDVRIFGHDAEGEGFYIGNTAKPATAIVRNTYGRNILVTDKGRDALQLNSIVPDVGDYGVDFQYVTTFDNGIANESGQWFSLQLQNASGVIKHSIFDTSIGTAIIATNGFVFENVFWNIANDAPIIVQDFVTQFASGTRVAIGEPIIFKNCHFRGNVAITDLFTIAEENCGIILINCKFSDNISNIFQDNRTDKLSHSVISVGGTVLSIGNMPAPTYVNMDETDLDNHGKVTNTYHLNLGQGYRSPIVAVPNTVAYPPTGLTATETGETTIDLSWTAPTNNGGTTITGYKIERNTGSSWSTVVADTSTTGTTYSDSGLTEGTQYYYRISAITSLGTGAPSDSAEDTTQAVVSAYDVFDVLKDQSADATVDGSNNITALNGHTVLGTPLVDVANDAIHVKGGTDGFEFTKPALASGFEIWMHLELQTSGSTQWLLGLTGNNGMRIDGGRQINLYNTNTGYNIPASGYELIRIRIDGASSFIQAGADIGVTNTVSFTRSTTVGTANGTWGRKLDGSNSVNAKYKLMAISSTSLNNTEAAAVRIAELGS